MDDSVLKMALHSYGYGRWEYPYWFIGPEQGQGQFEEDKLEPRVQAWRHFGERELDDSRAFHEKIGDNRWYGGSGKKPRLQSTWYRLILILFGFLEKSSDDKSVRDYQRDRWGRLENGETCVIELSGLAARSFKVPRERDMFRKERIEVIRQRMQSFPPALMVMYGLKADAIEGIVGLSHSPEEIVVKGSTTMVGVPHPARCGWTNERFTKLGERLRLEAPRLH